jgi:steroid 5-alpha reductase family enzyme
MDFSSLISATLVCLFAAALFMSLMFAVGRSMRRYDVVDVSWGLVFIVITITALLQTEAIQAVHVIVLLLVGVWGLRLSSHIYRRLRASTGEDKRYIALRKKWAAGNEAVAVYVRIYLLQAVLATLVCLPVIVIMTAHGPNASWLVGIGVAVWLSGLLIEALADKQLRDFIRNPEHRGQLMTQGLWRYSRHPNYFGELVLWWGIGIIAVSVSFGWIGLVGPALLSYLIIFVSGIPPIEKTFAQRAGWGDYRQRTSVLIPWFTRGRVNS